MIYYYEELDRKNAYYKGQQVFAVKDIEEFEAEGLNAVEDPSDFYFFNEVPKFVENWKLRVVLNSLDISDKQVQGFIDTFDEESRLFANAAWNHAPTVTRKHPLVSHLGQGLGLDENSLNKVFIKASKIK